LGYKYKPEAPNRNCGRNSPWHVVRFVPVFIAGLMLGAFLAEMKRDVSLIKCSTAPFNTIATQVSTGP
jgi:hypothetical protein